MSLQKKTATPSSVKLEMTREQLEMMVYMLGAIDLRTDPKTLEIAMDLRKKLDGAQKFMKKPKERPTDQYGKHLTDKEIEKAQAIAAEAQANSDSNKLAQPHRPSPPAKNP